MGSEWDEIQRLAADFQKAQSTSTLQKLSERNCVEIVSLLIEKKYLEVVFTNDGKEYVTPDHLEREIMDEMYANGGRVNLVEVSKTLNIDLSRIEDISNRISANNTDVYFMLGQLINEDYIKHIAEEINEKLSHKGEISISDLTLQFDLPSDFLQYNVVEKHLNKIIRGRQDPANPRVLFTQAYIQRCKAKIRGALAAITQPTKVSAILQQINVQEKIFHSILEEISPKGYVTSKQANAEYIPNVYAKMQADWVTSFYKQNRFLEYDTIMKLGISDAKQYIKKQFINEDIIFLKRCAIGSHIIDLTLMSALNECNASKSYVDLSTILPTNMEEEDIEEIFNTVISKSDIPSSNFVYLETIVFSKHYLAELIQLCHDMAKTNAKSSVDNGIYQQYLAEKQMNSNKLGGSQDYDDDSKLDKRDERRKKAASGKAGGGSQGRETKTKSTKKHYRGNRGAAVDSDEEGVPNTSSNKAMTKNFVLIKTEDIAKIINNRLTEEGLDHLTKNIAGMYQNQLNQIALEEAQKLHNATPQSNRRQTHASIQEKLNTLLVDIRLYEKGLKLFPADVQLQLVKYLLKTLGNDICNELTMYVANECNIPIKASCLNIDQRIKVAQECDSEYKVPLIEMNKSLNKTLEDFVIATEAVLKACSMIIKKIDKKKDRLLIIQHREKLRQQLVETQEPALVLHLTSLILFTTITSCILHASGRFVAQILSYVRPNMNAEQNELLMLFHDLVLKVLQIETDTDEAKTINEQLIARLKEIKDLASSYEKPGIFKAD